MRILVVDDKFESRWVIAGWLSALLDAVAVESAASGDEALAAIEAKRPDLVLAAHPMAGMDGIELARRIAARANPPVVAVMTDKGGPDFAAACAAVGAHLSLEKRHLQARLLGFLQERFSLRVAPGARG
ncbi:MAG: response regulator [Betaproteobacteria bacterium]|nr:response regulator [Betaproteobacteria bacterium]